MNDEIQIVIPMSIESSNPVKMSVLTTETAVSSRANVVPVGAVSPTIELIPIEGGTILRVHDINGTQQATIIKGEQGDVGDRGPEGPRGPIGQPGPMPQLRVGAVSKSLDGCAIVTITGTQSEPVLNFTIPQGPKGDPGEAPPTDSTLTQEGVSSDAKAVGDAIRRILQILGEE